MLSVAQAESIILDQVQPIVDQETVDLLTAVDRVLAEEVRSDRNFPYWDNSAMDGYAVRFADVQTCSPETPAILEVVTEIPTGTAPQQTIQTGQAARLFTGSMMPSGADTVVMQENTRHQGHQVQILQAPQPQAFVRHQGDYYQAGEPLLAPGTVLNAPEIAILATAQWSQIPVYRRPVVAILSTGSELVAPDQPLKPGQIIDSNRYALAALVQQSGGEARLIDTVEDTPAAVRAAIETALDADFVISSGGVSVGDYDFVDQVLAELGATIHVRAVAVKPGKPLTVAAVPSGHRSVLYFGLPGNPVSALVSFWRFVQPALRKLSGRSQNWGPIFVQAKSQQDLQISGQRETYLWGQLRLNEGFYKFSLASGSHSSGNLMNLSHTNGLAVLSLERPTIKAGELIQVMQVHC
ncbi:MAG: molybdopterin molybdenumtransferase MoeA [Chloroflexi bacterium AL-N5]|nr:molybdopterin molybdenumtransferase MoeA [Chloroflexi bacterium AL-N5]